MAITTQEYDEAVAESVRQHEQFLENIRRRHTEHSMHPFGEHQGPEGTFLNHHGQESVNAHTHIAIWH